MTKLEKKRGQMCPCGHERAWHVDLSGPCTYDGHGAGAVGPCKCEKFRSRRRAVNVTPTMPSVDTVDPYLDRLRALADLHLRFVTALAPHIRNFEVALTEFRDEMSKVRIRSPLTGTFFETEADVKAVLDGPREMFGRGVGGAGQLYDLKEWKPNKCERSILRILSLRSGKLTEKGQLAVMAGYASTGGGFANAIGALNSRGLIEKGAGGFIEITDEGRKLSPEGPYPTGSALRAMWASKFGKCERAILDELVMMYPHPLSKVDLANRTGYEPSGGGFANALGKLRTLELIEGKTELKAADALVKP